MKISAVIAEYNIFHNGHKYMIDKIRENTDAVIAVMSGSFVQRGDAAITDKWVRSEMALLNGVDLVIELPVIYALNTAQKFALGGVSILNSLGVTDEICFGSESGNISDLTKGALLAEQEPADVSAKIKEYIKIGMSYPSAREKAYSEFIDINLFKTPNNILAIEYIRSLIRLKSSISPVTVRRFGAEHDNMRTNGNIASASAIRDMIINNNDYSQYIPDNYPAFNAPYDLSKLDSAIIYKLRTSSAHRLADINDVREGLENRIIRISKETSTINELAEKIKTKRYTRTGINRILISSFLELTSGLCSKKPTYIRILGMNKTGMEILSKAKKICPLPIITKTADFNKDDPIFMAELRATEAFSLCAPDKEHQNGGLDFKTSPVII